MKHIYRPAESGDAQPLPQWRAWRGLLAVAVCRVLTLLRQTTTSPKGRGLVQASLLLLGLVVQGVLLLTVAYLCDLSISLMELWADLARKHLELTLS